MNAIPVYSAALPIPGQAVSPILVLGLGNILMQDEGIGVRAIERLRKGYLFPEEVEVLDGGTAGMALYEHVVEREHLIVIDAVKTGQPAGTVVQLQNDEVPAFLQNKVSPHQLALSDILATLKIAGEQVPQVRVIGVEPLSLEMGLELSETVAAQLDTLVEQVVACLRSLGVIVQPIWDRDKLHFEGDAT